MRKRIPGPLAAWLGVPGLILALYGSIVMYELDTRAEIGEQFLSTGAPALADRVVLQVQVGKGAPALAQVNVNFATRDRQSAAARLTWIDLDTPIPRDEEQQSPEPGSRYAPPLKILYSPQDPSDAIAEVDAQRLVENLQKYRPWAIACISLAVALLAAAGVSLLRVLRSGRSASA